MSLTKRTPMIATEFDPQVIDEGVIYPDSDGQPMAENTEQYEWIVTLKGNLDVLFAADPNTFVAGDHLIYPVRGTPKVRMAPDVYVACGRPKVDRGSYRVWQEGDVFPQVVFEVLSPGNRAGEMFKKRVFYEKYGAEEYYVIDPEVDAIEGWVRDSTGLRAVPEMNGFVSPRLGIEFRTTGGLTVHYPDGGPFLSFVEIGQLAERRQEEAEDARRESADERARADLERQRATAAQQRAEQEKQRAEQEKQRAEQEKQRADQAALEADRLRALLRAAGIDPDKPTP